MDLSTLEIDVLGAQHESFQQAQTGAVEQQRNEMGRTGHPAQHAADFVSSEIQAPQKVADLLRRDESVKNGSVDCFQKVLDACQKVVDSFFGFDDRFGGVYDLSQ